MREINYLIGVNGITPSSVQDGGFQCDYNSTKVIFTLEEELAQQLASQSDRRLWTVETVNAEGNMSVYPVELNGNKAELVLPAEITLPGTTASLQLVVTTVDENYIMLKRQCFSVVKIKFGQSIASFVDSNEYDCYAHNLVGAMSLAVDAAQIASQSAEITQTASMTAVDAAARAEAAANPQWQLIFETELTEATLTFSQKVDGLGDTTKGVRVAVYLPPNTTLTNNRCTFTASLVGSNALQVYIGDWKPENFQTVCVVDIKPNGLIWDIEVSPYTKQYYRIHGNNIGVKDNSKVRYVKFENSDTSSFPIGTKIKIWGLQ